MTTLYVFEISRIGRSFIDTLNEVRRLEEDYGVMVWSLSQKEEWTRQTEPSIRNLMLAIFSWVAERAVKGSISVGRSGTSTGEKLTSCGTRDSLIHQSLV